MAQRSRGALVCVALVVAVPFADGAVARPAAPQVALLTRVAVSRSAAADRVSFTFRSRPAKVDAHLVSRSALVGASGKEVRVSGSVFLVVDMRPAAGVDLSGAAPALTYRGPRRFRHATGPIVEVVQLEDFEGVLRWAVGLDRRHSYKLARIGSSVTLTITSRIG